MRRYLEKKVALYRFDVTLIDVVIEYLISIHLLDDMVFIGEFVRSRNTIKPKGARALRMELKKYGVRDTDIDTYLKEHKQQEEDLALRALRSKMKTLSHIHDTSKRFQKAVQFMQRRGFSYDTAKHAYNSLSEKM